MEIDGADHLLQLAAAPDERWGDMLLRRSSLYHRLADPAEAVDGALRLGTRTADSWMAEYGARGLRAFLAERSVAIRHCPDLEEPPFIHLGGYTERPETITIHDAAVRRILDRLSAIAPAMADGDRMETLVLAHETFHHLETRLPGIGRSGPRVRSWFRRKVPVRQWFEIAAGAFAKRMARTPFFPAWLEAVLLSTWEWRWVAEIGQSLKTGE